MIYWCILELNHAAILTLNPVTGCKILDLFHSKVTQDLFKYLKYTLVGALSPTIRIFIAGNKQCY